MARISPVTGHYVTIDVQGGNYRVFFLENGTGRPLVCQHTAGCHNHQWRELLEDESITSRYRVIAYDLAWHGKSDPPSNQEWWNDEYRLTTGFFTDFILSFCDALELDSPIFMGSSFGGNVALQLALRHPGRFAGVIPVEAADYSPGFFLDWWKTPHANAAEVCASGVWDLMAPQSPLRDRWRTWFYYTQGAEAFHGDLYYYSVDHDLRERLGEIDSQLCPVVMLTGAYDYLTTPEDSRRTADGIYGAEFIEMPDIGHFPMSENYPAFRPHLLRALETVETRTAKRRREAEAPTAGQERTQPPAAAGAGPTTSAGPPMAGEGQPRATDGARPAGEQPPGMGEEGRPEAPGPAAPEGQPPVAGEGQPRTMDARSAEGETEAGARTETGSQREAGEQAGPEEETGERREQKAHSGGWLAALRRRR
jgi:pimeloyl-ACP methyl ester carboxylesterase